MTPLAVEVVTAIITFVCSVGTAAFVSGTRWGRVEAFMADIEKDRVRQSDIKGMSERLARIEGMFTLRLKDPTSHDNDLHCTT